MTTVFLRRRRLGLGSISGIIAAMSNVAAIHTINRLRRTARREGPWPDDANVVIRWGCTANIPERAGKVLNTAEAIHLVNDKLRFRQLLMDHAQSRSVVPLCPRTWTSDWDVDQVLPVIVRPRHHAQGRNLHVCNTGDEVARVMHRLGHGNYYISELIDKVAEYRVFVAQGRAVWVARKTPGNPDDIAWNVARGGRFDNVGWGDWPLRVVRVAIEAFNLSGLHFGGVDVIVGRDGRAHVIEINSAPSQTSPYRQQCVASVFDYIINGLRTDRNADGTIPLIEQRGGWRKFIHPAVSDEAQLQ